MCEIKSKKNHHKNGLNFFIVLDIMTTKDLLKRFSAYAKKEGLLSGSSLILYRSYLRNLPFGDIDKILQVNNKWIVYQGIKNGKGTSIYYERFDGVTLLPPDFRTECSVKNYSIYNYYIRYIYGKNPKIAKRAGYDYLQLIADFLDDRDVVYALTIVDVVLGVAEKANGLLPKGVFITNLSNGISALRMFRRWLEYDKSLVQNVPLNSIRDKRRAQIVKPLNHKIDGSIALAREIGFDEFIQYAIEQCYFFQPEIIIDRRDELTNIFSSKSLRQVLPARKTEKGNHSLTYRHNPPGVVKSTFEELDSSGHIIFSWPIIRDKDNNDATRKMIKKYTGYTVAEGIDSIFKNYIISHIWGKAYDPRYFTNMWNIVLVPAWANSLLDKDNADEGTLEYILKETIMKIIIKLYGISSKDKYWNNHFSALKTVMPQKKKSQKVKQFSINIINNHDYHMSTVTPRAITTHKTNPVGYIVKKTITI